MPVTKEQLLDAVELVRKATEEFVDRGIFKKGVINRLYENIRLGGLP